MSDGVVIVGAGQAGFQVATSLRQEGFDGPITLIGDEPGLPYQRPPLSKGFMAGKQAIEAIALRPAPFYEKQRIELLAGDKVVEIDRAGRSVSLASGRRVRYGTLVLAVGARNRTLPLQGATLDGVCYLRTDAEAVGITGTPCASPQCRRDRRWIHRTRTCGGGFLAGEIGSGPRGPASAHGARRLPHPLRFLSGNFTPAAALGFRSVCCRGRSPAARGKSAKLCSVTAVLTRPTWC